jgi:hypothetical protein
MDLGDKEEIGMDVDAVLRDMDLVHVLADRAALPSMQVSTAGGNERRP